MRQNNERSFFYNKSFKNKKATLIIYFIILITFIFGILKLILKKYISSYLEIFIFTFNVIIIIFIFYYIFIKDFKSKNKSKEEEDLIKKNKTNFYITKDSYNHWCLDNSFIVFKSIYNILYIIYATENKSIIIYNLIENKKVCEIKNSHLHYINIFKYCFDKQNKKDIIMSVSCEDNNIKLWDINKCECILSLVNFNQQGQIFSACFLKDENNNNNYIVTSNYNFFNSSGPIKIYDFRGNQIKTINDSDKDVKSIKTFYDKELLTNYIITGNNDCVYSYDYNKNKLYHKYFDNVNANHRNLIVYKNKKENIVKIIESCDDGNTRIRNFHTCFLLNKIKISDIGIYGMCLWNYDYLIAGFNDNSLKLIDLKKGKVVKILYKYRSNISTIQTINHPLYGKCLISQGWFKEQIKIWRDINI